MQLDSLIWKPYASQAAEGGMLGEMDGFAGLKSLFFAIPTCCNVFEDWITMFF